MKYETMKKTVGYVAKAIMGAAVAVSLSGCVPTQYEVMQKQQEEQRKMYQTESVRSHAKEDHKDLDSQVEEKKDSWK